MLSVDDLREIYEKKEDKELTNVFRKNKSQAAISKWRSGGVPPAIELEALEYLRNKELSRSATVQSAPPPDTELQTLAEQWPTLSRAKRTEIMRALYAPEPSTADPPRSDEDRPPGKTELPPIKQVANGR